MYSASCWLGFDSRYASMSERTLDRRLTRSRVSAMEALMRRSSLRWSVRISRWRARLFCLRAEAVRVDSVSRRRESCDIRMSLWMIKRRINICSLNWRMID